MGTETYPKGKAPFGEQPVMEEDVRPNPYTTRAEMGDSPEEQQQRRMNVYGPGTGIEAKGGDYPKDSKERTGFGVNPHRTMRLPL